MFYYTQHSRKNTGLHVFISMVLPIYAEAGELIRIPDEGAKAAIGTLDEFVSEHYYRSSVSKFLFNVVRQVNPLAL